MEWLMLFIAGVFEVTWAVAMKMSEGFTRMIPSIVTAAGYIASAVFLAIALRKLPLGTAYAMWTGFGIIGTTILGIAMFNCPGRMHNHDRGRDRGTQADGIDGITWWAVV